MIYHHLSIKSRELESTFVEVSLKNGKLIIIACIYKHPLMPITEFNKNLLLPLLNKVNLEKKELTLLGDFNIDLMNCDKNPNIEDFIDF